MSTAVFYEAEALRPPKGAPLVMENYVANGQVHATYYRAAMIEKTLDDGTTVLLDGNEPTPLSQADAEAVMKQIHARNDCAISAEMCGSASVVRAPERAYSIASL